MGLAYTGDHASIFCLVNYFYMCAYSSAIIAVNSDSGKVSYFCA